MSSGDFLLILFTPYKFFVKPKKIALLLSGEWLRDGKKLTVALKCIEKLKDSKEVQVQFLNKNIHLDGKSVYFKKTDSFLYSLSFT